MSFALKTYGWNVKKPSVALVITLLYKTLFYKTLYLPSTPSIIILYQIVNLYYVNIRNLNANYNKLQVLIERFDVKPFPVCVETKVLNHFKYFALDGYKIYYNNSRSIVMMV